MPTRRGLNSPAPALPYRPTRRSFLRIGALGLGGLTLPGLLRAEAAAGIRSSHKSVILIYLVGGPPHQDLFDLKPGAPREIAGPWKPTATNVPGVQICEALPRLARIMDKLVVVRSLVGNQAVLLGVLAQIEASGLELLEVRRVPPASRDPATAVSPVTARQLNGR